MKIRVVDATLRQETWRLQPSRYVVEISRHLMTSGHEVQVISGGAPPLPVKESIGGIIVNRLESARYPFLIGNHLLDDALAGADLVLWHSGLLGLLHLRPGKRINAPIIVMMTSPLPTLKEIVPVGLSATFRNFRLHLVSALLPRPCPSPILGVQRYRGFLVMNHTTALRLERLGVRPEQIQVVSPGVDSVFRYHPSQNRDQVRSAIGFSDKDLLILFPSSVEPYRGLPDLLRALALGLQKEPRLRLLVLSRRRGDQFAKEEAQNRHLCETLGIANNVWFESGFLQPEQVATLMRATDLVALPFRAVASGTPLSVLEALSIGKPVITTTADCLPEIVPPGSGYCVPPRDPPALAAALLRTVRDPSTLPLPEADVPVSTWEQRMSDLDLAIEYFCV